MNPNRFVRTALSAAAALTLVAAAPARALEEHGEAGAGTVYSKDQYPYGELVKRPLTLASGLIQLDVPVEINLSKDEAGKPFSIPASLDFGLTDDLTVGVFHPVVAPGRGGLCLAGKSNGCPKVYDDVGARGTFSLFRDPGGQLALRGAVYAESLDEKLYNATIGAAYKRTLGTIAVVVDADVDFSLNKRSERLAGVKDVLSIGAEGQLQIAEGLAAFVAASYVKPLQEVSGADLGYAIPVGVGVEWEPVSRVDLGAELTFENLLGKHSTADERSARVFVRLFL